MFVQEHDLCHKLPYSIFTQPGLTIAFYFSDKRTQVSDGGSMNSTRIHLLWSLSGLSPMPRALSHSSSPKQRKIDVIPLAQMVNLRLKDMKATQLVRLGQEQMEGDGGPGVLKLTAPLLIVELAGSEAE